MSENTTTQVTPDTKTTDKALKISRAPHPCACLTGTSQVCNATTLKQFAQGHDARMSSRVATAIAKNEMTSAEGLALIRQAGGGDLLVSKTQHSAKLRAARGDKPVKAAKTPKAEVPAEPTVQVVGHKGQVFHGKKPYNAVAVRNAAGEVVARHRLNSKNCDHAVSVEDEDIFFGQQL